MVKRKYCCIALVVASFMSSKQTRTNWAPEDVLRGSQRRVSRTLSLCAPLPFVCTMRSERHA